MINSLCYKNNYLYAQLLWKPYTLTHRPQKPNGDCYHSQFYMCARPCFCLVTAGDLMILITIFAVLIGRLYLYITGFNIYVPKCCNNMFWTL